MAADADRSGVHDDVCASAATFICVQDTDTGLALADWSWLHGPHTLRMLPGPHHCRGGRLTL